MMPVLTTAFMVAAAAVFSTSTLSGATLLTIIAIRRNSKTAEPPGDTGIDALIEQLCKEDEEDEAACRRTARKLAQSTKPSHPLYSNVMSTSPGSYNSTNSASFYVKVQPPTPEKVDTKRTHSKATSDTCTTARTLSDWSAHTSTSSRSSISTAYSSKFTHTSRRSLHRNASLSSCASSNSRSTLPSYLVGTKHLDTDDLTFRANTSHAPTTIYAPGLDLSDEVHAHSNHRLSGFVQSLRVDDEDLLPALEQPAPSAALPYCICHVLGRQLVNAPWRGCMEHVPTQLT